MSTNDHQRSAIVVTGLMKQYGATRAVDGLSFEVAHGEVFGLLGPNGAGKTTTVEILEGYRQADAGEVRVLGLDPFVDGTALRSRVGVMLQEGGLYPGLRTREVIRLFAAYHGVGHASADQLLDDVGLTTDRDRMVRRLSGGQRQRLSLACALVGTPEMLVLDEPTAGMDPQARATTWELVRSVVARGTTVVLTTHLLDEAERLCDRVAIVAAGRLAALGSPHELTSGERREVRFTTAVTLDPAKLAHALDLALDAVVADPAGQYRIQAAGTPSLIADLATFLRDHDIAINSLEAGRQSLEDVFMQLVTEEGNG